MEQLSVTQLNSVIKRTLDEAIPLQVAVFGEISGFKITGAHAYFTLKDENSSISCNCFNCRKTYLPKDGESVVAYGKVDFWTKGGRLNLNVNVMEPQGKGKLFQQFEQLKAKLLAEGYFDEAHKKPIKPYNRKVLVVTSKTGAVIRDICTTVRRKNPFMDIVVRDVRVQGDGAAYEIAQTLLRVDKLKYDVIILARGGGSLEDLAPFYDEWLVKTIYAMDTPIVSAIGHETDFSLCDFVADARAATPTAAAELVAFDYYATVREVRDRLDKMKTAVLNRYTVAVNRTKLSGANLCSRLNANYAAGANRLKLTCFEASKQLQNIYTIAAHKLEKLNVALDSLSPLKTLDAGYFKLLKGETAVDSVNAFAVGDKLTAVGKDGKLFATVDVVERRNEDDV